MKIHFTPQPDSCDECGSKNLTTKELKNFATKRKIASIGLFIVFLVLFVPLCLHIFQGKFNPGEATHWIQVVVTTITLAFAIALKISQRQYEKTSHFFIVCADCGKTLYKLK